MILTRTQIRNLAMLAGFPTADIATAVAVCLAESGGDPARYNPESDFFQRNGISLGQSIGRGSFGLWQIFRYEHPEFNAVDLDEPLVNAFAAFDVYHAAGGSFDPWSSYDHGNGPYKKFLENPETAGAEVIP